MNDSGLDDEVLDVTLDDEYPVIELDDLPSMGTKTVGLPAPKQFPALSDPSAIVPGPQTTNSSLPALVHPADPSSVTIPNHQPLQTVSPPWWPLLLVFGGPVGCVLAPFILLAGLGVALFACYFAPLLLAAILALYIWYQDRSKPVVRTRRIWMIIACGAALTIAWIAVIAIIGTTGANQTPPTS